MNLDIIPNGAIKRVHVSQNDVGRTLTFELFNNSTSYTIPSGATVKIQGTKPSGFGFSETCTVSGNVATIDTTEAMTDESGNIQTELSISYDDVVIGTSNFVLAVEKNPHPDTTTDGSMETIIPELTLLVNEVKGYAEEIEGTYHVYGSPWVASTVAQMTDTDKIYVYVGSESGYTNGNWYYYNGTAWVSGGVYNSVAVQTDKTLSVSGMSADAKAVGDALNYNESVTNADTLLFATNSAISDSGNGTYTIGTTDYGTAIFGNEMTLPVGTYKLYGVPQGNAFLSTDLNWANAFEINTDSKDKFITIDSETTCYLGYRNTSRPSSSFTIQPYLKSVFDVEFDKNAIDYVVDSKIQYLDKTKLLSGYYWRNSTSVTTSSSYSVTAMNDMPAGTYHINALSAPFTYFINKSTGVATKASDMGLSDVSNTETEITIDYDFHLRLTVLPSTTNPMFANSDLPSEYTYGAYGYKLTDNVIDDTLSVSGKASDSKVVGDKINALETFSNLIGTELYQYIDSDLIQDSTYYNGVNRTASDASYKAVKLTNVPSGTYHINSLSAPFTYFINRSTGVGTQASNMGISDIGNETTITIPYDADICLTVFATATNPMLANGELPSEYVYGYYAVEPTDDFKNRITENLPKTFYCGSSREYTTLKSVVEEATKYMDSIVYVDAETFDLVEEFGDTYLENYAQEFACGLLLKNRIHLIFAEGSKVVFNYTGSNSYIHRWFAPFNSGQYGFTLENCRIESTNCRYSVHDERASQSDAYHNIYKRCSMTHVSDGTDWTTNIAIGGGLGIHGDVLIEDGYYNGGGTIDISYHNSTAQNVETKSKVIVRNAYLNGTTLCANYGTSTEKSEMIVNGCSLGGTPQLERVITAQRADNMVLTTWNNEVRS